MALASGSGLGVERNVLLLPSAHAHPTINGLVPVKRQRFKPKVAGGTGGRDEWRGPGGPLQRDQYPGAVRGLPGFVLHFTLPASEPVAATATGSFDFSLPLQPPSSVPVQKAKTKPDKTSS